MLVGNEKFSVNQGSFATFIKKILARKPKIFWNFILVGLGSGQAVIADDSRLKGPEFDSCKGLNNCYCNRMLDECSRITSCVARMIGFTASIYDMIDSHYA